MANSITPPPELSDEQVGNWLIDEGYPWEPSEQRIINVARRAFRAGADQELEACCRWLNGGSKIDYDCAALLRAARRPKPPSLKEQALNLLAKTNGPIMLGNPEYRLRESEVETIRRALEAMPDD